MSKWQERIETDPQKLGGTPLIKNTRMPVWAILRQMSGGTKAEFLADHPNLTEQDVEAALLCAADILQEMDFRALMKDRQQKAIEIGYQFRAEYGEPADNLAALLSGIATPEVWREVLDG